MAHILIAATRILTNSLKSEYSDLKVLHRYKERVVFRVTTDFHSYYFLNIRTNFFF